MHTTGLRLTCSACNVRHDAWSYPRPVTAEKAIRRWNHHSAICSGEAARQRRKVTLTGAQVRGYPSR